MDMMNATAGTDVATPSSGAPRRRRGERLALVWLWMIIVIAALAPLLASSRPYIMTVDGVTRWPLFRALNTLDILWLGATTLGLFVGVSRRLGRGMRVGAATLIAAVTIVIASLHTPSHERRHEALELELRHQLVALDEHVLAQHGIDNVEGTDHLTRDTDDLTYAATVVGVVHADLVARRRLRLPSDRTAFEDLTERNRRRLADLQTAVFPPIRHDPTLADPSVRERPPAFGRHLLGTSRDGRDLLAQIIHGARTAVVIALGVVLAACGLGLLVGALAGYAGGVVDWALSRIIETVMCLPALFLLLMLMAYTPTTSFTLLLVLGGLLWTGPARLVRAEVRRIREEDYVAGARALGASPTRVLWRHVLPNALGPLGVSAALLVGVAVLAESALAYLGLGPDGVPSWGAMLRDARHDPARLYHLAIFPGLAIFLTVVATHVVRDGERMRENH